MSSSNKPRKRFKKRYLLLALTALLLVGFADSNLRMVTTHLTVTLDRLPEAFDGFTIVHLSDLHMQRLGDKALLEAIADAAPDMIAITGDLGDRDTPMTDERWVELEGFCQRLTAIAPTYFVSGNHDVAVRGFLRTVGEVFERTGIVRLANDAVYLSRVTADGQSQRLCIAGVNDPLSWYADESDTLELLRADIERMGDPCVVLLSHRYERFEQYVRDGYDLVLTGHAHGGAIRLPFVGALVGPSMRILPKHTSGLAREGGTVMATSRGIAAWKPLPRLLNNPQVVVLTLRCG